MVTETQKPKVSVLLPSLNVQPYIRQCVESVTKQTLKDIEIICIDAGSTDGTIEIIEELRDNDSRIHIINSDKKSYGYQMNLGLKAANGKYIGIIETDDYADLNMFEQLYLAAEKNRVDVVKSNCYFQEKEKAELFEWCAGLPCGKPIRPKDHLSLFLRRPSIWSGFYKKSFLEENKIDFLETPGASYQDTSFAMKVLVSAEQILLLKDPYLHYRIDNPNSSIKSKEKTLFLNKEMKEVHRFLSLLPEKKNIFNSIIWDKEADVYNWNFRRLKDELKYEFLCGIQGRLREGLKKGYYDRRFLKWNVWKMIIETADDPFVYLSRHCDPVVYEQMLSRYPDKKPGKDQFNKWKMKELFQSAPQVIYDAVNQSSFYGVRYCVKQYLSKNKLA